MFSASVVSTNGTNPPHKYRPITILSNICKYCPVPNIAPYPTLPSPVDTVVFSAGVVSTNGTNPPDIAWHTRTDARLRIIRQWWWAWHDISIILITTTRHCLPLSHIRTPVKVKADIALPGGIPASELRDVTCHMGSVAALRGAWGGHGPPLEIVGPPVGPPDANSVMSAVRIYLYH